MKVRNSLVRYGMPLVWMMISGCATQPGQLSSVDRARLYVNVANGALKEGDPTGALVALIQAEKEDADLPELHHSRALAFAAKNDLPMALVSARRAVALRENYSEGQTTLGKLLTDTGQVEEAKPHLKAAAKDALYREAYKPMTILGIIAYRDGDDLNASNYFERAIQAAPTLACAAYYYRGNLRQKASRFLESISDYEKATKRHCTGGFPEAHLALGIAYEKNEQWLEAKKKYLEVQARFPHLPIADEAMKQLRKIP
jgi:Tfp pilus assembly protein PilF